MMLTTGAPVSEETRLCRYGDPRCPCQDGDMCHYEGPDPMTPPPLILVRPAGVYASELVVTDPAHGYQQAIPLDEQKLLGLLLDISAGLSRLAAQRRATQRS